MSKEVIKEGYLPRFLILSLILVITFNFLSAILLYRSSNVPLSPHYAAMFEEINKLRGSMLITTLKIQAFFYLFIAIGVVVLGIIHSHRVAGPLYRVKVYARALAEGKYEERINFRKKDVIHPLSSVLNEMAEKHQERLRTLTAKLTGLENELESVNEIGEEPGQKDELINRLRNLDEELIGYIRKIKL